jgi:hypothetical protein
VLNAVKRIIRNLMRLLMSAHPTVLVLECFKQMEKSFEQIDKRFEVTMTCIDPFMVWSFFSDVYGWRYCDCCNQIPVLNPGLPYVTNGS